MSKIKMDKSKQQNVLSFIEPLIVSHENPNTDHIDIKIESGSNIHFLTHGIPCFVKIRNAFTGLYLSVPTPTSTSLDQIFCGDSFGSIFIIKPSFFYYRFNIELVTSLQNVTGTLGWYISTVHDSCMLKGADKNTIESQFYLFKFKDDFYIRTYHEAVNMFGNLGRFIYMTRDPNIYTDGDMTTEGSLWKIEKINDNLPISELRNDYLQIYLEMKNISRKNIKQLFPDITKPIYLRNLTFGKYLSANIIHPGEITDKVKGDDEKMLFFIRPDENNECVYISIQYKDQYLNLYTMPFNGNMFLGAPDCPWAKFYINKVNQFYTFQCYHREANKVGEYGRYIYMLDGPDFTIASDGASSAEESLWVIEPSSVSSNNVPIQDQKFTETNTIHS